jgi:amino acid permease
MPFYLHTVGLVPGLILIVAVGMMTTWTDYLVGKFKLAYPEVYTLAE